MTAPGNDGAGPGDGGDELADDPQLRSMRAVWLSMRDEEPSAGGLAALMAAAHAKAEEMRPAEPWWQRALAALRRPPVLALATVVVLLGGALVISGRRDGIESTPMVELDGVREKAAADRAESAGAGSAAGVADTATATATAPLAPPLPAPARAPASAPAPASVAEGAEPPPDVAESPANVRPTRPTTKMDVMRRGAARDRAADRDAGGDAVTGSGERDFATAPSAGPRKEQQAALPPPPPPPPPPPAVVPVPPPAPKGASAPKSEALAIADDGDVAKPRPGTAGGGGASSSASADGRVPSQSAGPTPSPTLEQLAKQSQTAAARGDCAAVRSLVDKIRKLDAAFHKAHVEGNAAVQRCMK